MTSGFDHLPYRPCAGVMLVNPAGGVFVGQRIEATSEAWQMPQGGIDPGETPRQAALRELTEEAGVAPALAEIIAGGDREYRYDLPPELIGKLWRGKYRGQAQHWFLARFLGDDADITIATAHPEFKAWRWADIDELEALIVPFKRALYRAVVADFRSLI